MCSCRRVNLALAYTELTEELGRVRSLAVKQSDLLRHVSQEPGRSPEGLLGFRTTYVWILDGYSWLLDILKQRVVKLLDCP